MEPERRSGAGPREIQDQFFILRQSPSRQGGIIQAMKLTQRKPAVAATLILVSMLGAGLAQTQTRLFPDAISPDADNDAPPVYIVEFLIFAYNDFNPFEEEFPPEKPQWPDSLLDVRLTSTPERLPSGSAAWYLDSLGDPVDLSPEPEPDATGSAADAEIPTGATIGDQAAPVDEYGNTIASAPASVEDGRWYQMLEANELELGRALARLDTLDAYTPLLHAGWSQATMYEDEAQPFELAWLGKLRSAGSIRLHRSRFLHLTVDVRLQDNYRYLQAPLPANAEWPLAEFMRPPTYRIDIQRRVRSGELHFFDHPAFGILISVRPAPETPDAADDAASGPAA